MADDLTKFLHKVIDAIGAHHLHKDVDALDAKKTEEPETPATEGDETHAA